MAMAPTPEQAMAEALLTDAAPPPGVTPDASAGLLESFRSRFAPFHAGFAAPADLEGAVAAVEVPDSDDEQQPRSKLRRQWLFQSTTTPVTPPLCMESSPGASSGAASWQLIHSETANEVGALALDISGTTSSFQRHAPETQLEPYQQGCILEGPFGVLAPQFSFSISLTGKQHSLARLCDLTLGARLQPPNMNLLDSASQVRLPRSSASTYAVYPKESASAIQASVSVPTPRPLQPQHSSPSVCPAFKPRKQATPMADAVVTSQDLHDDAKAKNSSLFAELCKVHSTFTAVLSQPEQSQHGASIRERLLTKVSDTTAARYLRSVQLFFATFEELGGSFTCFRGRPPFKFSKHPQSFAVVQKTGGLVVLPDLYGPAFALMASTSDQEKKESIPLPLVFVAFLEKLLLCEDTRVGDKAWCGSFLVAKGASLGFSDCQHVRWSMLCASFITLRGICYRTKTRRGGAPWGLLSFGPLSSSESWGMTWLPRWLAVVDNIWCSLKARGLVLTQIVCCTCGMVPALRQRLMHGPSADFGNCWFAQVYPLLKLDNTFCAA
eukprot:s325_g13.t1